MTIQPLTRPTTGAPSTAQRKWHCPRCDGRTLFDGESLWCIACGWDEPRFRNRVEAAGRLATILEGYRSLDPVVLGIPRGGVYVGAELARQLDVEFDIALPCKSQRAAQRLRWLRCSRPELPVAGRTVFLADDGFTDARTMLDTIRMVRQAGPARLFATMPISVRETADLLEAEVDDLVSLLTSESASAAAHYERLEPTSDEGVRELMRSVRLPRTIAS